MEQIYSIKMEDISYIQKAVQSSFAIGSSPQEVHSKLIPIYWEFYTRLSNEIYLKFALTHMSAHIKSGFTYNEMESLFSDIAKEAGYYSLGYYLGYTHYNQIKKHVKCTYYRINMILGPGSASIHKGDRTRDDLIHEIMQKITRHEVGTFCYSLHSNSKETLTYLIINEHGTFMQDNFGNEYKFILD